MNNLHQQESAMTRNIIFSACLFFLLVQVSVVSAQFEGKIVFDSYEITDEGSERQEDRFSMYFTKDRILLQGENQYDVVGSIKTEGVLIRLDFEDFVLLNKKDIALKISKQEIDAMMNMFGNTNSGSQSTEDDNLSMNKTGEKRTIQGYTSEKFIFTDKEDSSERLEVWMTKDLDIHWGMLSEPWGGESADLFGDAFPFNSIFREGYFPLEAEVYKSGRLTERTVASEISETSVAKAMVQIPPGVKVLSFQEYLFQKGSEY